MTHLNTSTLSVLFHLGQHQVQINYLCVHVSSPRQAPYNGPNNSVEWQCRSVPSWPVYTMTPGQSTWFTRFRQSYFKSTGTGGLQGGMLINSTYSWGGSELD